MKSRIWLHAVLLLAGLTGFITASAASAQSDPAPVVAPDGKFQGKLDATGQVREFRGIRYAQPAVGDLRWKLPQPFTSGNAVQDATKFGNHCPQPFSSSGNATLTEDCLFLNVYAPNGQTERQSTLPVMVYVHGGTLITGESDYLNAIKLVRQGAVVVTLNYRLGALGFFAHPALTAESSDHISGNYGMADQQAALKWVKHNIKAFGGDPQKVTLLGESAGAFSTLINLISPTAKGLFHRVIVMSGAYFRSLPKLEVGETAGVTFAKAVGCEQATAAEVLKCLRSVPVEKIIENQKITYVFGPGIGPSPLVDGKFLTETIDSALMSGKFNRVPVMNGSTLDESNRFVAQRFDLTTAGPVSPSNYLDRIGSFVSKPPSIASEIAGRYRVPDSFSNYGQALGRVGTDSDFACPARFLNELASRFVPTFAYEFGDVNAPENYLPAASFAYGAAHAADIQYIFPFPNPSTLGYRLPQRPFSADQEKLSDQMVGYWVKFATAGDPNGPELPEWPKFDQKQQSTQVFSTPRSKTETDFNTVHQCDYWDQLATRFPRWR